MAHHAYFATGDRIAALAAARAFAEHRLGDSIASQDIVQLSFELFSVEDARRLIDAANMSGIGGTKVIIASMTRVFHEAQNALLKNVEEPPEGTTIILCVPSAGVLIPTLRSRLLPIFAGGQRGKREQASKYDGIAARFLAASFAEREKIVGNLLDQTKSDKDDVKQQARREAIEFVQGLTTAAYGRLHEKTTPAEEKEALLLLEDLAAFTPVLYERSAPLKPIFEHVLQVVPQGLGTSKV